MSTEKELRKKINDLVGEYFLEKFGKASFVAGKSPVRYAGRVFDEKEIQSLVDSSLDFWLTEGRYAEEFQAQFAEFVGVEYAILTNSGSSANLLAFCALTSETLGEKRLKAGDEVISVAAGFPTTVNPIIQNGLVPVFCDVDIGTYNINIEQLKKAIGPKTKAIFLAHTLGNPYDLDAIVELVKDHNLWLIEDCCDALGSRYKGKHVGTFAHVATCSFYPAHHITIGEGGMIFTDDSIIARAVTSFRDWGRDCYCKGGENNTCGKRFGWKLGALPEGYDHKYIYSEIGYNLKVLDLQAAIGLEQLKKLPAFIRKRKENFTTIYNHLREHQDTLLLPTWHPKADPSWFAFPITVREDAGFSRKDLTSFLESKKIETRMIFGGNILKQPAYMDIGREIRGSLENTDRIMSNSFFVGVYPGITEEKMGFMLESFDGFFTGRT